MLDIRRIREETDAVRRALSKRGPGHAEALDEILALDEDRRAALGEVNDLKAERNRTSKLIGELKRKGEEAGDLVAPFGAPDPSAAAYYLCSPSGVEPTAAARRVMRWLVTLAQASRPLGDGGAAAS